MFVLRKVRSYQRAHKFYLLFFMSWCIVQACSHSHRLCLPLSQFQTHRWGNVQVLQIFSRLFSTHSHPHTLTTTTEMSSLCFNEMCVACVRSRNARRRRRRAAEKSVWGGGKGAVRQRCCCHLKNCAQKYATVCRAFNINTIYVALTSFYFFFQVFTFLPALFYLDTMAKLLVEAI